MTPEDAVISFQEGDHEGYEFTRGFKDVSPKRSANPHIHAVLRLEELSPSTHTGGLGVSDPTNGRHYCVFLDAYPLSRVAPHLTPEICLELLRCGVRCTEDGELYLG